MENPSLIDQIKSEYIKKNIFGLLKDIDCCRLTFGKKSLLDNVFKPAFAATKAKFRTSGWPEYLDLVNNVAKDTFSAKGLADELNISNWPKYSEAIYATVKFMANEICDDYAKKLNNGYDKFPEDLRRWFDFYKETDVYHDLLEKGGAEYFNREARPYVSETIICLLLIEIIDLGCKKELFDIETLNKYLAKHPKEKSKNINRWFNSLVFSIIYNALGESLKDKVNEKNVSEKSALKRNINEALCGMTHECMFSNRRFQYIETEDDIIQGWLKEKLNSYTGDGKNFITNACFWYIKMKFKEEGIAEGDCNRKAQFNQASRDLQLFIFKEENIDCESVNELLKKDSSFSFLFPNKQVDAKEQTSKEIPKQEQIGGKYK